MSAPYRQSAISDLRHLSETCKAWNVCVLMMMTTTLALLSLAAYHPASPWASPGRGHGPRAPADAART